MRNLLFPSLDEREVAEEMAFHLEKSIEERIARGEDPAEARRQASLEFGGVEKFRAAARDGRFGHRFELWGRDLKLACRRLWRAPAFSVMAILTLALGLGAAGSIWGLGRSLLDPALPYDDGSRLVTFRTTWVDQPRGHLSPAELLDYEARLDHIFTSVGAAANGFLTLRGEGSSLRLRSAWITQGLLGALATSPALGRDFREAEIREGANLAIISHRFWRDHFASDPEILGEPLKIVGGELEIVGVLPPGIDLPNALMRGERHDIFVPMPIRSPITNRGNHFLLGYARLSEDVDFETARAEVEALGAEFNRAFPEGYPPEMQFRVSLVHLSEELTGQARAPLAILGVLVSFLLLVAITNVAALMLARLEHRAPELTLTRVLGAGRAQVMRQIGLEYLILIGLAGALGIGLAHAALRALKVSSPAAVAHLIAPRPDIAWLVVTLVTFLAIMLVGAPMRHFGDASSRGLGSRRTTAPRRGLSWRRGLVAGQVGLSLVLLTLAGLLAGSFLRLTQVDPGYRTAGLAATWISWPNPDSGADPDPLFAIRQQRRLLEQVRAIPGVRSAAGARFLVLEDRPGDMSFEFEGRRIPEDQRKPAADWQVVTPGYFATLGIPVHEGRAIEARDDENAEGAIVVDQAFAETFLPGEIALGRRVRFGGEQTGPRWARIVGVAGNVRHQSLDEEQRPRVYIAHAQFRNWADGRATTALHLIVDSDLPGESLQPQLRAALEGVQPGIPLDPLRPIDDLRAQSLLVPRLLAWLPAVFGATALVLAMIGIFGIVMQAVLSRRAEIGIRQALGAQRRDIAREIFWDGFRLAWIGGVLGATAALFLAKALESRLYATSAFDPLALLGAWALLALAIGLACLLPALRGARIDPVTLLRAE